MGKVTGFIEYRRSLPILREPQERLKNWNEFHKHLPESELREQGARCMNCGTPFCHTGENWNGVAFGCPLNNLIPEWNDFIYRGRWEDALKRLLATNNFPEFTGRVCPAPCESACTLGINELPVTIKEIEVSIIDKAFEEGWIQPNPPKFRTNKKVAIIGSGPAGLACADELNKSGHNITVFERADRLGGLLMYGIPNMKLDKKIVERRVQLMKDEGIEFRTNINVGTDLSAAELRENFDSIVICGGASKPRDLPIDGRELQGIYFAMDFLTANTKSLLDSNLRDEKLISVKDKDVIVIGGGDTGTDCVGTSLRHGCRSLVQFEIMPRPDERQHNPDGWLMNARTFQLDYGQEEAIAVFGDDPRNYQILSKRFVGDDAGNLTGIETIQVEWISENGERPKLKEIAGTEKSWKVDVVFLAMGFVGAEKAVWLDELGVKFTERGTIAVDENKRTNIDGIFAAGDVERGQSLIVWAIADGRKAAQSICEFLTPSQILALKN